MKKIWKVKKYLIEEFEVEASSREEAVICPENPHKITVTKITAKINNVYNN